MARTKLDKGPKLRIIPLGGVDEIGKNMTVIEYEDDIVVVDCGLTFPREDMLGIDLVIPDTTYLQRNKDRVRGYLITHAHEDHIGALPYVLKNTPAPVFGTRLTLALCELKFKEHKMNDVRLNIIKAGDSVKLGCFTVEFVRMNHSIAGAVALAIHTPMGVIVHTGDFKIDYTPVDGEIADLQKLAELGKKGVLCLLCDSTNVERPGHTLSEKKVGESLNNLFKRATGRIIIAMFASNIHRIQQAVDAATRYGRGVCLTGRSMINVTNVAMQLGELHIPEGRLIDIDRLDQYQDNEIVVITTGSQGEPMSGLARMANSEHRKLEIRPSDMVIISATPIPGNEKYVSRVINALFRRGAEVIYEALADIHASGHACQDELKLMHALVKPQYFIPVHGEYRHLHHHALLAESMGMTADRIVVPELGDMIEVTRNRIRIAGEVPAGSVLVDGLGIGDVGNVVLRDRKLLSQDGLLVVVIPISKTSGQMLHEPEIITRGFVYVRESDALVEEARHIVERAIGDLRGGMGADFGALKTRVRDDLHEFLYKKTRRSPMILPVVVDN